MTATLADAPVADWVTPELITTDPGHVADELRRTAPVAAVPFTGGLMLSSFGLIKEFLGDYTRYTAVDADGGTTDRAVGPSLMRQDGPEHTRQRRQIMQSLRPRAVEHAWGKVFTRNAAKRIDDLIAAGPGANLDEVFSQPYAADNLAAVVGLPGLSFTDLVRWSGAMTAGSANLFDDPEVWDVSDRARADVDAAIDEAIPYLREHPDSSMLSVMIHSDDRLPDEVIRANIKLAISGGINEPQHTVTNGVWALSRHPEQLDRVRERPSGFLNAFDEVVRVYPPIHLTVKKSVAHDIELGGVRVPGGSSVISFFYAGNRDPKQFENPSVFDVTRERRPGLTFGIGAHGCAGAHIAKAAVGGAAWPMLYERLGGLRAIDPEAHQQEGWVFRRLPELPVTWDEVQA